MSFFSDSLFYFVVSGNFSDSKRQQTHFDRNAPEVTACENHALEKCSEWKQLNAG
jgi:hypothetical protein